MLSHRMTSLAKLARVTDKSNENAVVWIAAIHLYQFSFDVKYMENF